MYIHITYAFNISRTNRREPHDSQILVILVFMECGEYSKSAKSVDNYAQAGFEPMPCFSNESHHDLVLIGLDSTIVK